MKSERYKINNQQTYIHYLKKDHRPPRPTILFLHGLGSTGKTFYPLMRSLSDRYHVIAVDLPGHGDSEAFGRVTKEGLSTWLLTIMDSLQLDHAHLAGHSIGGDLALQFAVRYPDRVSSLILLDGGYLRAEPLGTTVEEEIMRARAHCETFVFPTWASFMSEPGSDLMKENMHEKNGKIRLKVDIDTAADLTREMAEEPSSATIENWTVPTLLMRSTKPEELHSIRERETERITLRAPVQVIDICDSTHELYIDNPARVKDEVKYWVESII
ncbi:alpha/beta fold hydrolase [Halobacillus salinus]|uniref:Alpha/beta hydrolase n=1 Tax=Halobacillus salinus TaxID=192814 RepID=A0A4Z0H1Z3_9BACI|nr:alpha/beta hydrolase [Halobacillus salinus]TGB04418.1 alpha/beta hydrolase [Halobacillus salinus]